MALPNYVKFLRGTPTAYANLTTKDMDTLYFISTADSNAGSLYLGTKLISNGVYDTGAANLSELADVQINTVLADQVLYYNGTSWVNKNVSELNTNATISVMVGATADVAGMKGLVPAPAAGDQLRFLRGDGTWATVDTSGISADLTNINNQLNPEYEGSLAMQVTKNTTNISILSDRLTWVDMTE